MRNTVLFAEEGLDALSVDTLLSVESILEQVEREEMERREREKRKTIFDLKADELRLQRQQMEKDRIAAWLERKKTHVPGGAASMPSSEVQTLLAGTGAGESAPTTTVAAAAVPSIVTSTEPTSGSTTTTTTTTTTTLTTTSNSLGVTTGETVVRRPSVYGVPVDEWERQRHEKEDAMKRAIQLEAERSQEQKQKEIEQIRKRLAEMDEQPTDDDDSATSPREATFLAPESARFRAATSSDTSESLEPVEEEVESYIWEDRFADRLEGFLMKQDHSSRLLPKFRRRWFSLQNDNLVYYRGMSAQHNGNVACLTCMHD